MAKNGGGCFSGKDATKVDRSAKSLLILRGGGNWP